MPIVLAMRALVFFLALEFAAAAGHARAGAVTCWFENGAVVVPASFGDIAGDFILDTSAPRSQLHLTSAQAAGITSQAARATLRVAGERISGFEVDVADLDARGKPFIAGIAGVIGADALTPFVTSVSTSPCRVRMTRGRAGGGPGTIRLPLRIISGALAVGASISDGSTSRTGWFAVDTGSGGVRVSDAKLSRDPPAGADPALPPARLRALSIGGLLFEQVPAGLLDPAPAGLSGAIGEAIWSRFRLTLNPHGGWLALGKARHQERAEGQ